MTRTMQIAALAVLMAVAVGCPPPKPPVQVTPGALAGVNQLDFLGVDFSRARFYDPNFIQEDVVNGKMPSWNRKVLEDIITKYAIPVQFDIETAETRNKKVGKDAFSMTPVAPGGTPSQAQVQEWLKPYVGKTKKGYGYVIFADTLSKPNVTATSVVFERANGRVIMLDQQTAEAGGFGVHNFYLNGLKAIAKRDQAAINAMVK